MKNYLLILFLLIAGVNSASPLTHLPGNTLKVACIGNSVTFGYGLKDCEQEYYPVQLCQMLGENYEVRNFGKSGATLCRHPHFY